MAWKTINRNEPAATSEAPVLTDAVKVKIEVFFERYPARRAVLLPALHIVQDELGHIPWPAMEELADLLDIPASDVFDTVSFYTYFWTHPRGTKTVTVCRSISCEVLGSEKVLAACKDKLGVGEHETTADGAFSLQTEECLAMCDHGPCMFVNERPYHCVTPEQVGKILDDPDADKLLMPRSELFDGPRRSAAK